MEGDAKKLGYRLFRTRIGPHKRHPTRTCIKPALQREASQGCAGLADLGLDVFRVPASAHHDPAFQITFVIMNMRS